MSLKKIEIAPGNLLFRPFQQYLQNCAFRRRLKTKRTKAEAANSTAAPSQSKYFTAVDITESPTRGPATSKAVTTSVNESPVKHVSPKQKTNSSVIEVDLTDMESQSQARASSESQSLTEDFGSPPAPKSAPVKLAVLKRDAPSFTSDSLRPVLSHQ